MFEYLLTAATEDKCEMEISYISEDNNVFQQRDRDHHGQKKGGSDKKKKEGGFRKEREKVHTVGVEWVWNA